MTRDSNFWPSNPKCLQWSISRISHQSVTGRQIAAHNPRCRVTLLEAFRCTCFKSHIDSFRYSWIWPFRYSIASQKRYTLQYTSNGNGNITCLQSLSGKFSEYICLGHNTRRAHPPLSGADHAFEGRRHQLSGGRPRGLPRTTILRVTPTNASARGRRGRMRRIV